MENTGESRLELHQPPEKLLTYPHDRVKALMDSPDQVAAAIDELAEAGFDREQIFVLCGPEGAERLDVSGRHHGLRGRIYRFVERFIGDDIGENLQRSVDHMNSGGLWVTVPADHEDKVTAAEILARHGAHHMVHYGRTHHERLGPH